VRFPLTLHLCTYPTQQSALFGATQPKRQLASNLRARRAGEDDRVYVIHVLVNDEAGTLRESDSLHSALQVEAKSQKVGSRSAPRPPG
jgi:hypothetical protein